MLVYMCSPLHYIEKSVVICSSIMSFHKHFNKNLIFLVQDFTQLCLYMLESLVKKLICSRNPNFARNDWVWNQCRRQVFAEINNRTTYKKSSLNLKTTFYQHKLAYTCRTTFKGTFILLSESLLLAHWPPWQAESSFVTYTFHGVSRSHLSHRPS